MGLTDEVTDPDADTFRASDFEDIVTIDQYDLYLMCRFGPDADGNYQESILSMFDYEMLCKNQKTDFCTCDETQLYTIQDGQFSVISADTEKQDEYSGTLIIAVIAASLAVVLVSIAIIVVVVFFVCRYGKSERVGMGGWADKVVMGAAVGEEPEAAPANVGYA